MKLWVKEWTGPIELESAEQTRHHHCLAKPVARRGMARAGTAARGPCRALRHRSSSLSSVSSGAFRTTRSPQIGCCLCRSLKRECALSLPLLAFLRALSTNACCAARATLSAKKASRRLCTDLLCLDDFIQEKRRAEKKQEAETYKSLEVWDAGEQVELSRWIRRSGRRSVSLASVILRTSKSHLNTWEL